MAFLQINIASRSFKTPNGNLEVLKDIKIEVNKKEFLCIVGPSGCGKTTFLKIIAGLDLDYTGEVIYNGEPIQHTGPDRLLIFQDLGLFPWLNVQKNVEFGLKIKNLSAKERKEKAMHYLEIMHLLKFKDSFIHQLSGGMCQRVALARALVMDPEVLLMDEPFAALDALTRDMLHEELQRIWSITQKTIIFVTHNVREAVCLGERVLIFGLPPTGIKAQFQINLPRPRHIESQGLIERVRPVLAELRKELGKTDESKVL